MTQSTPIRSLTLTGNIGLYDICNFFLTTGGLGAPAGRVMARALWCFDNETIAIPRAGLPIAGFTQEMKAAADVAAWSSRHATAMPLEYPLLIWTAATEQIRGARLVSDGARIEIDGDEWKFEIVPKIPLNRSYFDHTSVAFLVPQALSVRGSVDGRAFVARTIWPESFRIDSMAPVRQIDATATGLRGLVREEPRGGARSAFTTMTLWEREPGSARRWEGKPVLGAMLNGAQGDDDEAHAGHFAMVTGRVGREGAIGDWLADNFYTLDSYSEKGIIASIVPLDNYLADLNSGQAWYRPSYLIVAILNDPRAAERVQTALCRVYSHFYSGQLPYDHATMNCASISIDAMRAIGWKAKARGPTSRLLAILGLPYFAVRERSLSKAANTFNYLTEDKTRLFPAVAFEELGADLIKLARRERPRSSLSTFESCLADDIEALVFIRVPQLPSSRAWGDWPIASIDEYRARVPADPALAKIVPVPPRLFPEGLRPRAGAAHVTRRGKVAVATWGAMLLLGVPWLIWRFVRRGGDRGA